MVSSVAPTLARLRNESQELQSQLGRLASEAADHANQEYLPRIVPALQDLVVDLQDTIQLAGN